MFLYLYGTCMHNYLSSWYWYADIRSNINFLISIGFGPSSSYFVKIGCRGRVGVRTKESLGHTAYSLLARACSVMFSVPVQHETKPRALLMQGAVLLPRCAQNCVFFFSVKNVQYKYQYGGVPVPLL